jgi:mono/diheme cytochrome c family protein
MDVHQKRQRRIGWMLGAVAATCCVVLVEAGTDREGSPVADRSPIAADGNSVSRGRSLFSKHCAECHGPRGRGDGKAGRDLDPTPSDLTADDVTQKTDVELFKKITRGRRPMPSYRRLLSEEDRWHVVNYVRSLEIKPQRSKP